MKKSYAAALVTLIALAACGAPARLPHVAVSLMVTPSIRELGYANGYPPPGQCRIDSVTRDGECAPPLNGIRLPASVTVLSSTTETPDHAVQVKAAVGSPATNDALPQSVFGQLLVHGRPVVGAKMWTSWQYRGGTRSCTSTAGPLGVATCSEPALDFRSRDGGRTVITVSFTYRNHVYRSRVSYEALTD